MIMPEFDFTKWSHSRIDSWMKCPEFFKLRYIDRIEPIKKSKPLALGGAMAEGVASYRVNNDEDMANAAFMKSWVESGRALDKTSAEDPKRSVERGLEILQKYMKAYPEESSRVVMPEIRFQEELWPGIYFRGILDGLFSEPDDNVTIIEDKTVSWLGDAWFNEKRNSYQVKWYMGVARHLGLYELGKKKIPRAIINAIYIHKDKFRFERQPAMFMNRAIDEAMVELKKWIDFITNSIVAGVFPQADYSTCMKYGGCDFLPLKGTSGRMREKIIANRYKPTESQDHKFKEQKKS